MSEDIIKEEIVEVQESQEVVETIEEVVEESPEEVVEEVEEDVEPEPDFTEDFEEEVEEEVEEVEEVVEKKTTKKKTSTPTEPGMYYQGNKITSTPSRLGKKWVVVIDGRRRRVLRTDIVTVE